jgi:hypothetical protein
MITKKIVNGKELVTSCTLANCCLTFEKLENGDIKLTNEKNQELVCSRDELIEVASYIKKEVPAL